MTVRALAALLAGLLPAAGIAQQISSIDATPASAAVGEPVRIRVNLDTSSAHIGCGLKVLMGDGTVHELRADPTTMPIVLSHVYPRDGQFTLEVHPFMYSRGLRTALPCGGEARATVVSVADTAGERRRQEEAARREAAERQRAQREVDERAKQLQAQERALQAREAEARRQAEQIAQRAEALRRKESEIAARDRAIKARETAPRRAAPTQASAGTTEKSSSAGSSEKTAPTVARGTLDAF